MVHEEKLSLIKLKVPAMEVGRVSMAFDAQLSTIESELQRVGHGREVGSIATWIVACTARDGQPPGSYHACSLSFGEHADGWRLLVRRELHVPGAQGSSRPTGFRGNVVPLLETSRQTRIGAAQAVVEIIEALDAQLAKEDKARRKVLGAAPTPTRARSTIGRRDRDR